MFHVGEGVYFKKRYTWVVSMGALWEAVAFFFRCLQTRHQNNEGYDSGYTIFFLLAPLWINAFLYMTLGRMIYFFVDDRKLAGISAQNYGVIFVWLDIIAFLVQLAGASITSQTDASSSTIMIGVHIYMGGIGVQELFILIFTFLFVKLHRQMLHRERLGTLDMEKANRGPLNWRWVFYGTYVSLGMITIRIIFRLGQYAQGTNPNNPVLTHEYYEYVFDALPIFTALVTLNWLHPGRVLQGEDSEFPHISSKERKRLKREKLDAKRAEREERRQARRNRWRGESRPGFNFQFLSAQENGSATLAPESLFYDTPSMQGAPPQYQVVITNQRPQ
ncbi:hypothetical protein PISL3812_05196 [Talaromyces islandicus]|uniref:Protein RTA1 n=1 Tax=Talaromyces islandicus TaxID=28573 RepID=A0A0U1LXS4_TALIS|nr:hypothetical protein PISL3812_05196 [Talaromyces islandicus]